MKREDLLKEMKEACGTKEPVEYFTKLTEVFNLLFDRIDLLDKKLERVKTQSALAVHWEPKVASDMLSKQVDLLRQDKDTYFNEIDELKKAFSEDVVTQSYTSFCNFWQDVLGWHPFLD